MGILTVCVTVMQLGALLGKLGLDVLLVRLVAGLNTRLDAVTLSRHYLTSMAPMLLATAIVSGVVWWQAPLLATLLLGGPEHADYMRWSAIAILPVALQSMHAEALRGFKRIIAFALYKNWQMAVAAVVILLWTKSDSAPLGSYIVANFLLAAMAVAQWMKVVRPRWAPPRSSRETAVLLQQSLPMMIAGSVLLMRGWVDTILLGALRAPDDVGLYNVATRLALLPTIALMAVNSIAAPKFAELHASDPRDDLPRVVQGSTRLIFWASFPVTVIMLVLAGPAVAIFGDEFHDAALVLRILLIGQFVNCISGSVGWLLQMTGYERPFQHIMFVSVLVTVVLDVALIPRYGALGAAVGNAVGSVCANLWCVHYIWRTHGFLTLHVPGLTSRWTVPPGTESPATDGPTPLA
jgi:O-antigen/teichoic acid export membrane protein